MSNFWDGIIFPSKAETIKAVEVGDFWSSIGLGVKTTPVKQSKPKAVKSTAKTSKAVVQAEKVYETVEGLVVPAEDCKHYWIIPSQTAWTIGVCKVCNGERWFSNRFKEEGAYKFNDTLVPPKAVESIDTSDADIRDITTVYKAEQNSIEESE